MTHDLNANVSELLRLAGHIERSRRATRVASMKDARPLAEIATEAADSLLDIRASSRRLFSELLPRLMEVAPETDEFDDLLSDVTEEYRHIYYHLVHTELFASAVDNE